MNNIETQIAKFKKETGVNLQIKCGKPHFDGHLDLRGTAITALPENLTVGEIGRAHV